MRIGAHVLRNALFVAPMAGVTDRPFRQLARRFGAGLAVSEMVASRPELRGSRKSRLRLDHEGEAAPISVQIAGADPALMADAARYNVARGAQIIDINMGCPAKKVCNVYAGSALLGDEALVARILEAVVTAVDVPVTLKIRTGPSPARRNAVRIGLIAQAAGVQLLAIHGRTRACGFAGRAEYETISEVKSRLAIPVIANGDIRTPEEAEQVLRRTGADGAFSFSLFLHFSLLLSHCFTNSLSHFSSHKSMNTLSSLSPSMKQLEKTKGAKCVADSLVSDTYMTFLLALL